MPSRAAIARSLLLAALLTGCAGAPPPAPPTGPAPVADNAAGWYRQASAEGASIMTIDPAQSIIAVTVRRGGPLARLGHDHVVASHTITGFAAPDKGRADFSFRLDQMTVDEPALRREAGLDTEPSADAIASTRANMLGRVLEAGRFPLVALHAQQVPGDAALRLTVTLHGTTRTVTVPARIETGADSISASGAMQLRQSDYGITPMSVLGGAMTVLDPLELRFRIVARTAR
jgi:polyisoprenoid-binding protein YceI